MAKVKTGPKVLLAVLVIGGAVFGARWYVQNHGEAKMQSTVPEAQELEDFKETEASPSESGSGPTAAGLPSDKPASLSGPPVRILIIPWNAQMGLALANGGATTTEGSLMQKYGVNLKIERQDDYGKMQEALVACANELSKGKKRCVTGANFVTIMGDAAPMFLQGLNETLAKVGPDYVAEIVGSAGRSNGEDKFMGPPEVKDDPSKARGLLIAGVLKDGDWNIAMFWAAQNDICNNPDVTTYDPNCLNWVGTSSFVDADEKYIQGACEERPVVKNGKKTGDTAKVCVTSVVTWTPGDVAVAQKKGGVVSILSTKENSAQMPNAIIGIRKWNAENADTLTSLLRATFEAGDQIKRDKSASQPFLMKAAAVSAKIYGEGNAAYWAKYYRGVTEQDKQGLLVELGGSRVFNLADNLKFYGLEDGAANAFEATYVTFGNIAKQQYPKDLPTYPAASDVINPTYIKRVAELSSVTEKGVADAPSFDDGAAGAVTVAKRSWSINFETGKATFTADTQQTLNTLLKELVVAGDTIVEIHGHTDNVGNPEKNLALSEARANAVRSWLKRQAPANFPEGRLYSTGHGQEKPVADNATAGGKAKNRRVEIVLLSKQ